MSNKKESLHSEDSNENEAQVDPLELDDEYEVESEGSSYAESILNDLDDLSDLDDDYDF